ncbi:MAG: (deoxy)nucleoside triphosphate pyrophosphohydrolase [Candidatus Eisenbacteria bacterium]
MTRAKPFVRVVAGVAYREGRFLAALRPEGKPYAGRWEFPGGKVEAGETDVDALRRELREELGVEARIGREIDRGRHEYPEKTVDLHFYRIVDLEGEPSAIGVGALRWFSTEGADDEPFLEGDREFLEKMKDPAFVRKWFS